MFNWFGRKEEPIRVFADYEAAFTHACTLGYSPLLNGVVPAIVEATGKNGADGERWFSLRLAVQGGATEIWGCTLKEATAHPQVGDLVAFRIVRLASDLPEPMNIIGFIACKLKPELVGERKWRIEQNYTPDNLKPELHM